MRVLVADDDPEIRTILEKALTAWGHSVTLVADGREAWDVLRKAEKPPPLILLDWMMPGIEGPDICARLRGSDSLRRSYVIVETARSESADIVQALNAGADDFVSKPFDMDELRARVKVGVRMVQLQRMLADRVVELEDALASVKTLQGLLPVCCYCRRVEDDDKYWSQLEDYVSSHSGAELSHSVCPDCQDKLS